MTAGRGDGVGEHMDRTRFRRSSHGGGFGCLHLLGIGCLGLLILIAGVAVFLYYKGKDVAARALEAGAERMLATFEVPAEERSAAMAPIRDFLQRYREGKASTEQVIVVTAAVMTGPAGAAIAARGFEIKYVRPSDFTEAERTEARIILSRFAHGAATRAIPQSEIDRVLDMISVPAGKGSNREFKESLTREELQAALSAMKAAADRAGVERREFKVDLAEEIRKAIATGTEGRPAGALR